MGGGQSGICRRRLSAACLPGESLAEIKERRVRAVCCRVVLCGAGGEAVVRM